METQGLPDVREALTDVMAKVKAAGSVSADTAAPKTEVSPFVTPDQNQPQVQSATGVTDTVSKQISNLERNVSEDSDSIASSVKSLSAEVTNIGSQTSELSKLVATEKEQDDKEDSEHRKKQTEDFGLVRADIRGVMSAAEGNKSALETIQSTINRILANITALAGKGEGGEGGTGTGGDIESLSEEFSGIGKKAAILAGGGALAMGMGALYNAFTGDEGGEEGGSEGGQESPGAGGAEPRSMGAGGSMGGAGASGSWEAGGTGPTAPKPASGGSQGGMTKVVTKSGKAAQVNSKYAKQFQGFINELEGTGYKIKSLGGFADRNARGSSKKSYHAMGAAIDINPQENPMGKTLITDMPSGIGAMAKKYGLGWGGNWKSVKDAMHFSAAKSEGGSDSISRSDVKPVASPTKPPAPSTEENQTTAATESDVDGHQHDEDVIKSAIEAPESGKELAAASTATEMSSDTAGETTTSTGGETASGTTTQTSGAVPGDNIGAIMQRENKAVAAALGSEAKPASPVAEGKSSDTGNVIMNMMRSFARSKGVELPSFGESSNEGRGDMLSEAATGISGIADMISPESGIGQAMSQIQSQVSKAQRAANSRTAQNLMQVFTGGSKQPQREQPPKPPVLSAFNPKYMMQPRV